jgi:hypothetical protein
MATSEVSIVNSALSKLGAELIITLSDNNKRARFAAEAYPKIRDQVLAAHPWNFAISRKELGLTPNTPAYEFQNEFALPLDVLRVISTDLNVMAQVTETAWSAEISEVTGDRVILTDASGVKIKYIKRITDVAKYPPHFLEALETRLASELAYTLVQSTTLKAELLQEYLLLLRDARSFDAQEGSLPQTRADDWFNQRF